MTKPSNSPTEGNSYVAQNEDQTLEVSSIGRVNDFLVLGGAGSTLGSNTNIGYYIQWSAINDGTDWPTPNTDDARAKQSGQQSFDPRWGWVTGIAGNEFFGYVLQENAITKMTYVGGDVVFTFDRFEEGRGCRALGQFVQADDQVFFRSDRGFHRLENDQIDDIGLGQVDGTFGG